MNPKVTALSVLLLPYMDRNVSKAVPYCVNDTQHYDWCQVVVSRSGAYSEVTMMIVEMDMT